MSLFHLLRSIADHPLNRHRRLAALGRFARWQLATRLFSGDVVHSWLGGSKLIVGRGEHGLTGNLYNGLHEYADMAYWLHVLRPGDRFVDVGANAGAYTVLAGAVVGAAGYAFEAVPSTYRRLLDNVRINHLEGRVKCRGVALGGESGRLLFSVGEGPMNHAVAAGEACSEVVEVEVHTLDAELAGVRPSVIKIDVEGYELPVLEGAADTLSDETLHSVIMELNGSGARYGYADSRLLGLMYDAGFSSYVYHPRERRIQPLGGKNPAAGNTLFIRNEAMVEERLRMAPAVEVHGQTI